jgi:uracil-DNA glycosylase
MELQIECPASYPPGCKIVFVGEAPGRDEVEKKEGFVGAAGRVLQRACSVAGLDWSITGKSNIAKRRPSNNKFREAFYETIEEPIYTKTGKLSKVTKKLVQPTIEYNKWVDALHRELELHHPNLIVVCGNEALEAVTELRGITNYRGSIIPDKWSSGLKILAVEHPSYILRGQFLDFWILCQDLKKAKREMEFPEIRREPWVQYIAPGLPIILGFLHDVANAGNFTLDVETRAGTLACFAIAFSPFVGEDIVTCCIPIQTSSGPYWSPEDELEIWRALNATAKANPNLCNQNIEYDIDYILRYGVEPSGVYMDTMLAHSLLYPEFPKDLGFLGSFYLDDVVYWKQDHRDWSKSTPDEALWGYNCKDAVYTLRIVDKIDAELKRRGLFELYHGEQTHQHSNRNDGDEAQAQPPKLPAPKGSML